MNLLEILHLKHNSTDDVKEHKPVTVDLEEVKQAVLAWEEDMEELVDRTVLMKQDHSIDMSHLERYLGGLSNQKFYMSRYTFEIFDEADKEIPINLDIVQAAVDSYLDDHLNLPIIHGTPNRQVHYDKLIEENYLKEKPSIPLYLTTQEFMLTHEPNWNLHYV